MPVSHNLAPLFKVCTDIANEVSDSDGFVSVRRLLERFRTNLRLRPLLVEGMIGSTHSVNGQPPQWTILVDSERYPGVDSSICHESAANPLPARFRFTVAHELAHSLAFRTSEFGVQFEGISDKLEDKSTLVETIERETDRLAPLLLCPEQVLTNHLRELTGPLDVSLLTRIRRECGISREVLLSRLALSRTLNRTGLWQRPRLREFGLAIAEWNSSGGATLRRWPVFLNFGRLVPKGLLTLRAQDNVPFEVAFGQDSFPAIRNGTEVAVSSNAGTAESPDMEQLNLEISAEGVKRAPGSSFLALVRNRQIRIEIEEFERIRMSRQVRGRLPTS